MHTTDILVEMVASGHSQHLTIETDTNDHDAVLIQTRYYLSLSNDNFVYLTIGSFVRLQVLAPWRFLLTLILTLLQGGAGLKAAEEGDGSVVL